MKNEQVAFIGLGYIGLPTAVTMAKNGLHVVGIDVNAEAVERINRGEITIVEPGLEDALKEVLELGTFKATTRFVKAQTYVVAVPTPFTGKHEIDMKYINAVADSLAPVLTGDQLIILESTSPPLTTRRMAERILAQRPDLVADEAPNPDNKPVLYFAHCPERILPGQAMEELVTNDRIIGGESIEATTRATELYRSFCKGELLPTDSVTAEMAKLTENSFRDVNIAFANELSLISDRLGINVWELINLANHHPRVNILQPGPGVGGHCIAVDPWFIVSSDPLNSNLIRTAREVNDRKPQWVIEKIQNAIAETGASSLAILGLAFKPNIDDLRESPALEIAVTLAERHPDLLFRVVEPNVSEVPAKLRNFQNVTLSTSEDAISSSEVVVLLVDHKEFQDLSSDALEDKTVIDTKGILR